MFDLLLIALVVYAVIYGVGALIFRRVRVVEALRKAQLPQEQEAKARPSGTQPWQPKEYTPARPSVFESQYETIRDRLEPARESQDSGMSNYGVPSETELPSLDHETYFGSLGPSSEGVGTLHRQAGDKVVPPAQHENLQPVSIPGINLSFNADTLVQGVIFSEILTRKGRGGRR